MNRTNISDTNDYILEKQEINNQMRKIKHKLIVLSGKGGVGKSTVAVNIALGLAVIGKKVGLLDIDIHGPSIPKMLNLEDKRFEVDVEKMKPIQFNDNLSVMSIAFFLPSDSSAVIWRGPLKMKVIKQFLSDVDWGELDYLVIDSPPGTGDEPLSICQLIEGATGSIIVTTPQKLSIIDVKKCVSFCNIVKMKVLGVVENMSGLICPHCKKEISLFGKGGGERMANEMNVDFLGAIPMVPEVVDNCDNGVFDLKQYKETIMASIFKEVITKILLKVEGNILQRNELHNNKMFINDKQPISRDSKKEGNMMRIALPIAQGKLSSHFGHCEQFALVDVDDKTKEIISSQLVDSPPHQPGLLPQWLQEKGVNIVITGGMGSRAISLFEEKNIKVVLGAKADTPERIVMEYLNGTLELSDNICDH